MLSKQREQYETMDNMIRWKIQYDFKQYYNKIQLVKIKEHLVSNIELKENKKNYCDIYKTNFDDIEYENEHYYRQLIINKPFETLEMRIDSIQKTTSLEIQNIAKELFDFNKVHIITFGKCKKNKILERLKSIIST
jgi:predicted Zn-dependent peptidase